MSVSPSTHCGSEISVKREKWIKNLSLSLTSPSPHPLRGCFKGYIQSNGIRYIHKVMQSSPLSSSRTFSSPQKETLYPLSCGFSFSPSQTLRTTNVLSVFMDLPIEKISQKQIQHGLSVISFPYVAQDFQDAPFCCRTRQTYPILSTHSACFQFLAVRNEHSRSSLCLKTV